MATRPILPTPGRPATPVAAGPGDRATSGASRPPSRLGQVPPPGLAQPPVNPRKRSIDEKSVPYVASGFNAGLNMNCCVAVHPGGDPQDTDAEEVTCRHFAFEWARSNSKAERRKLTNEFADLITIRSHFEGRLHQLDAELTRAVGHAHPDAKHLFDSEQLGAYLSSLARALDGAPNATQRSEANSLLLSCDHAFALHVQKKTRDGADYFSAKLYDPNSTASYRRVEAHSPAGLAALSLATMLRLPEQADNDDIGPGQPMRLAAVCLTADLRPDMPRARTEATAEDMRLALQCNIAREIGALIDTFRAQGQRTSQDVFTLLDARTEDSSVSGLHLALQDGHAGCVSTFVHAVLGARELNDLHKMILLEAVDEDDGCPGLFMAMQEGRAAAVRAYARAVLGSALADDQKVNLLEARSQNGKTGLAVAGDFEQTAAVDAFTEAVRQSSLPSDLKARLVMSSEPEVPE